MTTISPQARKRRIRRLRHNIDRLVARLYDKWVPVSGKEAPVQIGGGAVTFEWERELHRFFAAECRASGRGQAAKWIVAVVRAAAAVDVHFHADLIAAALAVGVFVPLRVTTVRTLGPGRRSPVVPNALRVAWSRA